MTSLITSESNYFNLINPLDIDEEGLDHNCDLPGTPTVREKPQIISERHIVHLVDLANSDIEKISSLCLKPKQRLKKIAFKVLRIAYKHLKSIDSFMQRCPLFSPERGDTKIYPKDSPDLEKKAKFIRNIKHLQANGAVFNLPLDLLTGQIVLNEMVPTLGNFLDARNTPRESCYLREEITPETPPELHRNAWTA